MILYEDEEFEAFSLNSGIIAVPLEIRKKYGRYEYEIKTYRIAENIAVFLDTESNDPLGINAIEYASENLRHIMKPYGYYPDKSTGRIICEFRLNSSTKRCNKSDLTIAFIFKTNEELEKYENKTSEWNMDIDSKNPFDVISAVCIGNEIAACAMINDVSDNPDIPEICVECAPKYRRRGFASACVKRLSEFLINEAGVDEIAYNSPISNTASIKTALSSGFEEYMIKAPFVFYRNQ